jgi:hypothetical protein
VLNEERITTMIVRGFLGLATFGRMALGLGLMVAALGVPTFAGGAPIPEIDGGTMVTALALLSGAVLVLTNRVRRN